MKAGALMMKLGFLLLLAVSGCRMGRGPSEPPPEERPPFFPAYSGEPLRLPYRRRPLEDFERLASISVSSDTGRAFLLKNTEQAIWGSSTAEVRFLPQSDGEHLIRIRPETPWRMPSLFDNISLWIRSEHEESPGLTRSVSIRLRDGRDLLQEIRLPVAPESGWQMLHQRITESFVLPVQVEEIRWHVTADNGEPVRLLLEGLTLYQEVLSRIPVRVNYVRPFGYAPAFAPLRANSVTLNFPDSAFAFRPRPPSSRHVHALIPLEDNAYQIECSSTDGVLSYRIRPEPGGPEVDLRHPGGEWVPAWSGAKIIGIETQPTLRFSRLREDELLFQYSDGVSFRVSVHGRTLVVFVESMREEFAGLDLGRLFGEESLAVPFLRTAMEEALPVRFHAEPDAPLFLCAFPDWWASMASRFVPDPDPQEIGRLEYTPRWRGGRNLFRERVYFTASADLADVLPMPASPQAMYLPELTGQIWMQGEEIPAEPYSPFRLTPQENEWEDLLLARSPEGDWRTHPVGSGTVVKTALAEDLVIPRLLRLQDKGTQAPLFLPGTTRVGPWRYTDFDNRVVGAGTFAQTYAEMGALLQQAEAEWGGAVIGAGGAEWLWAGLVTGFVPEFSDSRYWEAPWIPHHAWRSILPGSRLLGMGPLSLFTLPGEQNPSPAVLLDRSLAMQMAFGAPGRLPPEGIPEEKRTRARRLLLAAQNALHGRRLERIAYWDGTAFESLSQILLHRKDLLNQLYLRLEDQTEIWVNGASDQDWSIRVAGKDWTLPPYGFVLRGPEHFLAHLPSSTGEAGLCWVEDADSVWLSSPRSMADLGGISFQGCIRLHILGEGVCKLDITEWNGRAIFDPEHVPFDRVASVRAVDTSGSPVQDVRFLQTDGRWELTSSASLQTVWLYRDVQGGERNLSP